MLRKLSVALLAISAIAGPPAFAGGEDASRLGLQFAEDPSGVLGIFNLNGRLRTDGPFFQSLGSNGRSCATCHAAEQAFSFTPAGARARFSATRGRDPLFATVDGANCPSAMQSDRSAHSLLLQNAAGSRAAACISTASKPGLRARGGRQPQTARSHGGCRPR